MTEPHEIWIEQCDATEQIEEMRKDDICQCTRDLLLIERAREWLQEDGESIRLTDGRSPD